MKFKQFFEEHYILEHKSVAIQIINDLVNNIDEDETEQSFRNYGFDSSGGLVIFDPVSDS